jgi:PAS domain S-box-containing protein
VNDERARASSRADLAMILDGVADGVMAMDASGRLIFVNETAAKMMGFADPAAALEAGRPAIAARFELIDAQHRPLPAEALPTERALRGETPPEMLVGYRRPPDPSVRWSLVRSRPVFDRSGALRSVTTIFRDVTAARMAEDALRAANEALRAVVRASPLPIVVLDADANVRLWNPAAEKTFGWTEDDILGKRLPIVPEDLAPQFREYLEILAEGRDIPPLETKRHTRSGEVLDVTIWATSFFSPEGTRQILGILADATEARRAAAERERLLRQIETERNFLRVILEQLPVGARIADATGRIILANRQLEAIWRAGDAGQWVGFHADGRPYEPRDWPIFRVVDGESQIVNEEIEIQRSDGARGTLVANSAPVRNDTGTVVGAVSILSDITDRKRAEMGSRFLAEASRLLTSSLDHRETLRTVAGLAVPWLADWCAIHLVRKDGAIGTVALAHRDAEKAAWAEATVPDYRPSFDAPLGVGNVVRTGASELYHSVPEDLLERALGGGVMVEVMRRLGLAAALVVPVMGRQRAIGAITLVATQPGRRFDARDVELAEELGRRAGLAVENAILFRKESDARQAAESAARRTAILQQFAEALSEAPTEESIAHVIIQTGLRHLGADAGSVALVRGDQIDIARSAGYRRSVEERWPFFPITADLPIARAVRDRAIVTYSSLEELFESFPEMVKIEKWTHKSFAAVPLLVESRAIGAIGLSFLEARRFDGEEIGMMLAIARQCAQAVERARLFEAERAARADAEAANRAKDEFLATLSHELRTPMTATLGWARMLTMLNVDEDTMRVAIDSIHRSTQAQARIVDDLLDVARIVTGKMKIEPRPMILRPLIIESLESVKAAADARSIEIAVDLVDPPVPVLGDPDRLRQVVWNLLSNAIKFTHAGGHVAIRLERDATDARLTISDDGQGIRPDLLPVIFERFRQGDSSTSRAAAGLGLGLSIVKHLIELHGGAVTAQSDGEGKGSVFAVTIPIAQREATEPAPPVGTAPHLLAGSAVLVVDDEQDTCLMIASTLRQFGADVRTAASATEALALLHAARPHLVVSDLGMPDIDGFELAKRIRSSGDADLPLVALTAYGRPEDRERAILAGYTAYIRKPVDPDLLVESIDELLRRR